MVVHLLSSLLSQLCTNSHITLRTRNSLNAVNLLNILSKQLIINTIKIGSLELLLIL